MTDPITEARAALDDPFDFPRTREALMELIGHAEKQKARISLTASIVSEDARFEQYEELYDLRDRIEKALAYLDGHWLAPFRPGDNGWELRRILKGES